MSHDRGCYKCFEDRWNYKYCPHTDCPKRESITERKMRPPLTHQDAAVIRALKAMLTFSEDVTVSEVRDILKAALRLVTPEGQQK